MFEIVYEVLHFSCIIPNDDDDDDDGIVMGTCNITHITYICSSAVMNGLLNASKVNCINISDNVQ